MKIDHLKDLVGKVVSDPTLSSAEKTEIFSEWIEKLEETLWEPLPKSGQEVQDLMESIKLLEREIEKL